MDKFTPNKELMIREGAGGGYVTQALFYELSSFKEAAQYTLSPVDRKLPDGRVLPSIKRLYLECEDPTEYTFATTYFVDYNHWLKIKENKTIAKYVGRDKGFDLWAEELEIKLKSKMILAMKETAETEGAKGTTAARYIAEYGWEKQSKGRPTNKQKERSERVNSKVQGHVLELLNGKKDK